MKVARISYANTDPFFFDWPYIRFPLMPGTPRQLAQAAREGLVMAGPLPVVECWDLEKDFEPLGNWGIAAKEDCKSVFLLSHKPMSELQDANVGVTRESSTSVVLLQVLLRHRYGRTIHINRGLAPTDDAWLLIGDQALKVWDKTGPSTWECMADLAEEWKAWQKLPFVFARWVIKKEVGLSVKNELFQTVTDALRVGIRSFQDIANKRSVNLHVPAEKIIRYLEGFNYVLGREEEESMGIFRHLVQGKWPEKVATP
ncbi:MAG: menaquinone biosynthesis protein [Elusimicrobia bacterium]|nr:menaquinone biosynthesis protein [Candidatus Obscuribacterium magneticum]